MKTLIRFLICFLLTFLLKHSLAQTCTDTAKKINYFSPGYKLSVHQHSVTSNDQILIAGRSFENLNPSVFVIKLSSSGSVIFSKKITGALKSNEYNATSLLQLKNGNILLTMGQAVLLGSGDSTFKLLMLDSLGNIRWIKSYFDNFYGQYELKKAKETTNGDIVCMLNYIDQNPDHESDFGTAYIRIDSLGNVLWSNYTVAGDGQAFEIIGNNIYATGTSQDTDHLFVGYPDFEHNLWALKINGANGALLQFKSFFNMRIIDYSAYWSTWAKVYGSLTQIDDHEMIYTDKYQRYNHTTFGLQKSILDTNLNFSNTSFYNYNNTAFASAMRVAANNKAEVFTYADSVLPGGLLTNTFISKFDINNHTLRQLQLSYPAGTQLQSIGAQPIGIKNKYISLINLYQVSGTSYLQLYQLPDDVSISDCYGKDSDLIQLYPYTITETALPQDSSMRSITLNSSAVDIMIADMPLSFTNECVLQSSCSSIHITGPDSICNVANTYSFVAHKNGNCFKHVLWNIDSTAIELMQQINDSTINIRFKKKWQGYLYAGINSCSLLKDSIKLNVFKTPASIQLGDDTTICFGSSLRLKAGIGFKNYQWQNNSTDSVFNATLPGYYWVTAHDYCGNVFTDTILVNTNNPAPINLGNDTSICNNTSLVLNAGPGVNYLWNTGNTNLFQSVNVAGIYSVIVTNQFGCKARDTIRIVEMFAAPVVTLDKKPILCLNQNNILNAGSGYISYLWQNGNTDSLMTVTTTGWYKIKVEDAHHCFASDSVYITKLVSMPRNFLGKDSAICSDENILLIPDQIFNKYLWSNGSTASSIMAMPPANIWLKATDENGCEAIDTIKIFTKDCSTHIFIPNAFTPNADGKNDLFKPIISGRIEYYNLSVYSRYGQLIFYSSSINKGWDGSYKSAIQNQGTFVWLLVYKAKKEEQQKMKGTVLLLR